MSTINVDTISDAAGSGKPNFPNGLTGDGSSLSGISAYKPIAVTGTTPSLDVGAYNFFHQSRITTSTAISFASVPTDARWTYSYQAAFTSVYDLTAATGVILKSFSVNAQESQPQGMFFRDDGLKMYVIGDAVDNVSEYNLSTAWDLDTATYLQGYSVAAKDGNPYAVWFSSDGTQMYMLGRSSQAVHQYALSTAWNVTTASFTRTFSISSQTSTGNGMTFKDDGSIMYVLSQFPTKIFEYALSTSYNIGTASFTRSFDVGAQEGAPFGIRFKPDGLAMFIIGTSTDTVHEYTLSTAFNISTASFTREYDFGGEEQPSDLFFKSDGSSIFIMGINDDIIRQYNTSEVATLSVPSSVKNPPTLPYTPDNVISYDFYTSDGGTNVYLIGESLT